LLTRLYCYGKGMSRISAKNQLTIPVAALRQAGLRAGDEVRVEAAAEREGELRIYGSPSERESAFGALTGVYPRRYLQRLDAEDAER
jgi:bifunctional DNA-binding transcriptional regulator/antitoxin component of YhaV-PrlF toxin-antitoxin module